MQRRRSLQERSGYETVNPRYAQLASATDALVNASVVTRTAEPGYTIVRAPQRPDYWFGNCLILDAAPEPESYAEWSQLHAQAFKEAPVERHVVVWEVRGQYGGSPEQDGASAPERRTVFATRSAPRRHADIARIGPLSTAADWDAATEIEQDVLTIDWPEHRLFARWRFGVFRDDAAAGHCRVWGALCNGRLVAYAGLYANREYGRFITPVTLPEYRRRGIFGALCSVAVGETLRIFPKATIVIVADAGSEPAAIYEHLGFDIVGEQYALITAVE